MDESAAPLPDAVARPRQRRRHPLRWLVLAVGLTVVVVFSLVLGSRLGKDPTLVRSPLLGRPAPEFSLPTLDGGTIGSAQLAGRLYVVNFWASWCVPCRKEAPVLESFAQRWSAQGVTLVGVVYNDSREGASAFRSQYRLTYPQVMDPGGRTALDYGVFGVPETFVVDGRGVVMAKLVGAVTPGTLDQVITRVAGGETYSARNDQYRTRP